MFDEQPDGDPHGECAAEIRRLQEQIAQLRAAAEPIVSEAMEDVPVHPCDHDNEFVKVAGLSPEMQALYVALRDTVLTPNHNYTAFVFTKN